MQKYNELIEKCSKLKLTTCSAQGNPKAKLWIVGEVPGVEEEAQKIPFVGKSGRFLDNILKIAGVNRRDCFVTNVSPIRPPDNDPKRLEEKGVSWEECKEALQDIVLFWKPSCILALGDITLQALTGKKGITAWRGTILTCGGVKVVASFNPAYILRMGDKPSKKEREGEGGIKYSYGSARITLILDTKRAKEESQTPYIEIPKRVLIWEPGEEVDYLNGFGKNIMKPLAFDIESKGKWVDRVAFCWDEGISVSLGLDQGPAKEEIKEKVKQLLGAHPKLVAQNGSFDMTQLALSGLPVRRLYADTMIAHHVLQPELPHDLGYLASTYCKLTDILHPPGWAENEKRGYYNALHASVTAEIWGKLQEELRGGELEEFFFNYQMPLFHLLLKMYWRGVKVDMKALEKVRQEVGEKYVKAKEKWDELIRSKSKFSHASIETALRDFGIASAEAPENKENNNGQERNQET